LPARFGKARESRSCITLFGEAIFMPDSGAGVAYRRMVWIFCEWKRWR